jgi:hypothetical protein
VAKRKLGLQGDQWKVGGWERVESGELIVRIGIPGTYARGPRKGHDDWRGVQIHTAVVTKAEREAEIARFVAETGLCGACGGSGEEWWGWSKESGSRYQTCGQCQGSCKATPEGVDGQPQ